VRVAYAELRNVNHGFFVEIETISPAKSTTRPKDVLTSKKKKHKTQKKTTETKKKKIKNQSFHGITPKINYHFFFFD